MKVWHVRSRSATPAGNRDAEGINEHGGINGRKLQLIVESHGNDPRKAVPVAHVVKADRLSA